MILRPLFQWRPIGGEKQACISGGSHLPADIIIVANNATIINDKSSNPAFWQILTDQESTSFLDYLFSRDGLATESATKSLHPCFP